MAQQQWISPLYLQPPTSSARCVALKSGFDTPRKGSNHNKNKIYISVCPFFFSLFWKTCGSSPCALHRPRVQDRRGSFPACLVSESPVRTNKLIILTINTIILINVMHTRGFGQLETHIYIHGMLSFLNNCYLKCKFAFRASAAIGRQTFVRMHFLPVDSLQLPPLWAKSGPFFVSKCLKWPCAPPPNSSDSDMNVHVCHEIIHSISPHWTGHWLTPGSSAVSWLWILWYCKWLEIPSECFGLIGLCRCGPPPPPPKPPPPFPIFFFFLVSAILNSCSFPFRHHIQRTKQISQIAGNPHKGFYRRWVIRCLCTCAHVRNCVHFLYFSRLVANKNKNHRHTRHSNCLLLDLT